MTLDEAIEHARQVSLDKADESLNCDNECAREHWQLAEWLRELRQLRIENAKLREGINAAWRNKSCKPGECLNCPYACSWRTIGNLISTLSIEVDE